MAGRFFARIPVVVTAARSSPAGAFGGTLESVMTRKGSKNYNWYYRALEQRKVDAAVVAVDPFPVTPLAGKTRSKAFIDVAIGHEDPKRIVVELADDIVPQTVENFKRLCTGSAGFGYKGTKFHFVNREFGALAGTIEGKGAHSALGARFFADENFVGRHSRAGVVTMANNGRDSNSSVFCITTKAMSHLDGRNVAFGTVVSGLDVVTAIAGQFHVDGKPLQDVVIRDCGLL